MTEVKCLQSEYHHYYFIIMNYPNTYDIISLDKDEVSFLLGEQPS